MKLHHLLLQRPSPQPELKRKGGDAGEPRRHVLPTRSSLTLKAEPVAASDTCRVTTGTLWRREGATG